MEDPQPCRGLELDLYVSNQELKTDGNKMPAVIQKACGKRSNGRRGSRRFQRSCVLPLEPDLWEAGWTNLVPHGREWVSTGGVGKSASPPHSKEEGLSTKSHASPVSSDWLETDPTKLAIVSSVTFLLQGPFSSDFCRSHTF